MSQLSLPSSEFELGKGADEDRDVEKCKKILKAVDETKGSVQGQLSSAS